MTWKTSKGDRVLSGSEAKLFASAIATMCDMADDGDEGLNFGIPLVVGPFERLSDAQNSAAAPPTRLRVSPTRGDDEEDEGEDGEGRGPSVGCMDFQKWEGALECIADAILWDRDWEMEGDFAMMQQQQQLVMMRHMNVGTDYWRPFQPEAYPVRGARDRLYDMVRRISD
ncbi:hypothetical protein TSOC_009977 [Tetrabaena socialis]|uniref:Uncharacterized protein n=1 Tax=Tetrabaena socialis TaxID=47790 RepID=A0A2J7ZUG2_9CHLO|nr:hypothetical protein TSOC_009977 [Tetrabaena socialis]|eukprot:PNH03915.1 hypothetical protein TSOC_009977 [Tetrabaena socialis]